jgi:predicted amidohydrolase YtcJ
MNPFADLARAGVVLAFGSDSPVTELGPWQAVRAAVFHHNPGQRLTARAAFAAHTRGGWRAAGHDDAGVLAPGAAATYTVWDGQALPDLGEDAPLPVCVRTVVAGRNVYESEGWQG